MVGIIHTYFGFLFSVSSSDRDVCAYHELINRDITIEFDMFESKVRFNSTFSYKNVCLIEIDLRI